jgi:hypothetical protein
MGHRPGYFSHPTLGEYHLYTWCARCQCVNLTTRWAWQEWHCPDPKCDGAADDAWRWEEVRAVEPGFPSHPLLTRRYKLYAFDSEIEASMQDAVVDPAAPTLFMTTV